MKSLKKLSIIEIFILVVGIIAIGYAIGSEVGEVDAWAGMGMFFGSKAAAPTKLSFFGKIAAGIEKAAGSIVGTLAVAGGIAFGLGGQSAAKDVVEGIRKRLR